MLRLLCVTAHPDDEAGGFGGSLLLYRDRGVETHVICLTPGQAATHRGNTRSDHELATARRREFAESCRILGVLRAEVLDYDDGALDRADFYSVTADLVRRIREIRPHVVMTFGPEGAITAHPDHSMAGLFTTLAFQWAARSNRFVEQLSDGLHTYRAQKLYYATAAFTLPDRQPVALAPASALIEISRYFDRKVEAFRAHKTQAPLFPVFENAVKQRGGHELFHLAASITLSKVEIETDLFAGVVDD
ncbi:MAG TPA: PIG-L family deacetylase [Terriglobales bacterium]|nr:PIG-L family deacetylase [Terriglobales bacterium]